MPGDELWAPAQRGIHLAGSAQVGEARNRDRRLGVARLLELFLGALEADPAEREAQNLVCPFVQLADGGERLLDVLPHAHELRTLAGEYPCLPGTHGFF